MKKRKKRKMNEELEELAEEAEFDNNGEIHLWLADLKKAMEFENKDEAEGARKLIEKASWLFGTHGYQLIQEMNEEEEDKSLINNLKEKGVIDE